MSILTNSAERMQHIYLHLLFCWASLLLSAFEGYLVHNIFTDGASPFAEFYLCFLPHTHCCACRFADHGVYQRARIVGRTITAVD